MSKDNQKKFDELPGWQRHFIKRIVDHGNVKVAAAESGVAKHSKDAIDFALTEQRSFGEILEAGGITNETLVAYIKSCLDAETVKFDKNGNPLVTKNHQVTIKTIELILKIKGVFNEKPTKSGSIIDLFETKGD